MKKLIIGFIIGVALAVPVMLMIGSTEAAPEPTPQVIYVEPTPMPTPAPVIIYKDRPTDLEQVVANTKDSCVMIYAFYTNRTVNQGSGWAYEGYIVTARHVIEGAHLVSISTDDSENDRIGKIVYKDDKLDLAILKADISLPSVKLGDSDELIEGEKLVSITSPEGAKNMIDECLFSGNAADNHFSVSESAIAPGSSGGAVFNYNSEVIGMVVTSGYENAGLIPINNIKPILKNIK